MKAYNKWAIRIPPIYREKVLGQVVVRERVPTVENDPDCLARLKHYRSLIPMAQEVRKPIFHLTAADGAIGSHSAAVGDARHHFHTLAEIILARISPP